MIPESPQSRARRRRWAIVAGLVCLALSVGIYFFWVGSQPSSNTIEADGERLWPPSRTSIGELDLVPVHTKLLPEVCYANEDQQARQLALDRVAEAVEADTTLAPLVEALRAAGGLGAEERLAVEDDAVAQWNAYLRLHGVPLELQLPINPDFRLAHSLCLLAYAVVAEVEVEAGGQRVVTRLGSRQDRINVVEGYLGHASRRTGGAFVTIDATADSAANALWPMLAMDVEAAPQAGAVERRFGPLVAAELRARLPSKAAQTLSQTAWARAELVALHDQLSGDRRCAARLSLGHVVPLRGYSEATLEALRKATWRLSRRCPALSRGRLERVTEASRTLRSTPHLRESIRALTAVVAGNVVAHETRHVLDQSVPPRCPTCPSWVDEATLREFAAYLATLTNGPAPYSALYDICQVAEHARTRQHRRAAYFLVHQLLPEGCEGPIHDVPTRAYEVEEALLGRASRFEMRRPLPPRLPSRRY